jgi:uncharacterized protein (TIGR02246 family)
MKKWGLLGLVVALGFGLIVGIGKAPAQPEQPKLKGQRTQEFVAAFNKGDAKAVAGFWAPEGIYVDQRGHEYKGRAAIEKLYERVFAGQKGAKLDVTIKSIRKIAANVAIEEGMTVVTLPDGGPPTVGRFSAVLVQKDDLWYFESVTESIAPPPSNAQHFEDLDWLLGDWKGVAEKGESATASYTWEENRNFITCAFTSTLNGVPVVGGTQWIGWDAVDKLIRSWSFYSGGGVGEAVWTKDGEAWSIKSVVKTGHGKKVLVTNVLTKIDADHLTWQATKLTVDGKALPDAAPIKMKRAKAQQP